LAKPHFHALQVSCLFTWELFYSLVLASYHGSRIFLLGDVTFMVDPSTVSTVVPTCIGKTRGEGFCAVLGPRLRQGRLSRRGLRSDARRLKRPTPTTAVSEMMWRGSRRWGKGGRTQHRRW
jgi:hypothetical protein